MHSWHIPPCKNSVGCCQNCCCIAPSDMTVLFEVASPHSTQDVSASPVARFRVGPELWATWWLSRMMLVADLASSWHWLYVTWLAVQQQWTVSIPPVSLHTFTARMPSLRCCLLKILCECLPVFIKPHRTNHVISASTGLVTIQHNRHNILHPAINWMQSGKGIMVKLSSW